MHVKYIWTLKVLYKCWETEENIVQWGSQSGDLTIQNEMMWEKLLILKEKVVLYYIGYTCNRTKMQKQMTDAGILYYEWTVMKILIKKLGKKSKFCFTNLQSDAIYALSSQNKPPFSLVVGLNIHKTTLLIN